jgi:hypothetical protein
MNNIYIEQLWLWVSSLGVAYAIISFLNDINIFNHNYPFKKGIWAMVLGSFIYYQLPYKLIDIKDNKEDNIFIL